MRAVDTEPVFDDLKTPRASVKLQEYQATMGTCRLHNIWARNMSEAQTRYENMYSGYVMNVWNGEGFGARPESRSLLTPRIEVSKV